MTTPPNSLLPGEVGGKPTGASAPHGQTTAQSEHRPRPGEPGSVKIGKGVFQVELPQRTMESIKEAAGAALNGAAQKGIEYCKGKFEEWKAANPGATRTPIRFSMCSNKEGPTGHTTPDHRPPAPKAQQH